jgi:transcriptional antiterminator NusG
MVQTTNSKWYVIRVAGNKEKTMSEKIRSELGFNGLEKNVHNIIVPVEKKFYMKDGKKIAREIILYPGYVLIETDRISEVKNIIRGFPGVAGFIGDRAGNPAPLTQGEVDRMIGKIEELEEAAVSGEAPFVIGEKVKILDGPFSGFTGEIDVIDAKGKLKVDVMIFGRKTPVELSSGQLEKI